jgi:hypothetical protein
MKRVMGPPPPPRSASSPLEDLGQQGRRVDELRCGAVLEDMRMSVGQHDDLTGSRCTGSQPSTRTVARRIGAVS